MERKFTLVQTEKILISGPLREGICVVLTAGARVCVWQRTGFWPINKLFIKSFIWQAIVSGLVFSDRACFYLGCQSVKKLRSRDGASCLRQSRRTSAAGGLCQ